MSQSVTKILIVIVHIILGLILIFITNSPMDIYYKVHNPESYWPDYSVSRIVAEDIGGIILGVLSIVGALALRKDKRWAIFALPAITLVLVLAMFVSAVNVYPLVAGPTILFALILFIFFISETAYMVFRKNAPLN